MIELADRFDLAFLVSAALSVGMLVWNCVLVSMLESSQLVQRKRRLEGLMGSFLRTLFEDAGRRQTGGLETDSGKRIGPP